jgi:hypothetical protein
VILKRIAIDGFGRLVRLPPIEFAPGLTVVAGENEAGKSTLAECVIRTLFGYPNQRFNEDLKRYRPWAPGAPFRARIAFAMDDGREFETTRDFADDVGATTRTLDTQEQVDEWGGNRKDGPGSSALSLSLEAYTAAAVIRAGELRHDDPDGFASLSERLMSVVGAAGEEGADAAVAALQRFANIDIGSPQSRTTPFARARGAREKAEREREDASKTFHGLRVMIEQRAATAAEVEQLAASARKADYAVKASRLRALQNRLKSVESAQTDLMHAKVKLEEAERGGGSAKREAGASVADAEPAIAEREVARAEAASAAKRAAAGALQAEELRASLRECQAAIALAEAQAAELEAASASASAANERQPVDRAELDSLEAEDVALDLLESKARRAQTDAAIARQQSAPSPFAAAVMLIAGVLALIFGFDTQAQVWEYSGGTVAVGGLLLLLAFISTAGKRAARIRLAEDAADELSDALDRARDALKTHCRSFGVADVAAVRRLFAARGDVEKLLVEKRSADQSAVTRREQQRALEAQIDSIGALQTENESAQAAAVKTDAALAARLDALGIPANPDLGARIDAYRSWRESLERSAHARADYERANAALAQALGSFDVESLHHEIVALVEDLRDLPDVALTLAAAVDEPTARAGLADLNDRLADANTRFSELEGAFNASKPLDIAELEERVAACRDEEQRLGAVYRAAQRAQNLILEVKSAVHKTFLPLMNEMLGEGLSAVTGGKYVRAHMAGDFTVRLDSSERGGTIEPNELSDGTKEQVNLSLRVATAQTLASGERVPLILDDALAHADPQRAAAAMRWLATLGVRGIQSILFTQRPDLIALARDLDGVAVVDLAELTKAQ